MNKKCDTCKLVKIVYCTDTVCCPGGTQMITMVKASALAEVNGFEVWIVVTDNKGKPIFPISDKVHLVDLDVNYYEYDWKGTAYWLWSKVAKGCLHRKRLRALLESVAPDYVISTGTSEKFFLPYLKVTSDPVYIREFHFDKWFRLRAATSFIAKMCAIFVNMYDYMWKIKSYDAIVVLTEEDKTLNWKGWKNVYVIPNPLTKQYTSVSTLKNKVVVAVGRLVPQKNLASLIRVWRKVADVHPDWILQIWGNGSLHDELENQIVEQKLYGKVMLMGYADDVMEKMSRASVFALSSSYEGFGLVIVEAMSVGVPVVSYACPAGPRDIIEDGADGFLVNNGDEDTFADKICYLIEHEEERARMGKMALAKSKKYDVDIIVKKWVDFFNEMKMSEK